MLIDYCLLDQHFDSEWNNNMFNVKHDTNKVNDATPFTRLEEVTCAIKTIEGLLGHWFREYNRIVVSTAMRGMTSESFSTSEEINKQVKVLVAAKNVLLREQTRIKKNQLVN